MSYDRRYPSSGPPNRSRRPLYAPPAPGRQQHSVFGYWFPLITVSTIAIGGLAAWIWSERSNDDDDYHDKPPRPPAGPGGPYPTQGSQPYPGPPGPQAGMPPYDGPSTSQSAGLQGMPPPVGGEASSYYAAGDSASRDAQTQDDSTWIGQVRGAMRRTPSPQQFLDSASKQFGGAVAAAGAALGSIMEEDGQEDHRRRQEKADKSERREEREGFSDHERWSEEAEEKSRTTSSTVEAQTSKRAEAALKRDDKTKSRKTVALVVSADVSSDGDFDDDDLAFSTEHASILSHLPEHEPISSNVYILIYAPHLKSLPPIDYQPSTAASGLGSSYSQISTPAVTPASELQSISPRIAPSDSTPQQRSFDTLYQQALALVSHPSHILPFTTPTGFVQILRHLSPSIVYVSDTLSGSEGSAISQLKGWVGHTILVAGDEGHGGLADTETEDEGTREQRRWYERSSMVGLGKEVEVVDAVRIGEDWARRVGGRE